MTSQEKIDKATKLLDEKLFEVMRNGNQNLTYGELLIVINNIQTKWLKHNLDVEHISKGIK